MADTKTLSIDLPAAQYDDIVQSFAKAERYEEYIVEIDEGKQVKVPNPLTKEQHMVVVLKRWIKESWNRGSRELAAVAAAKAIDDKIKAINL